MVNPRVMESFLQMRKASMKRQVKILKKCETDIYAFLQLKGLDRDLKANSGDREKLHFRKALAEQSARKPPTEPNRKKKRKSGAQIPSPAQDVLSLQQDIQRVVWVMGELYSSHARH